MNKKNINNKKNARIRRGACTRYKQKLLNVTRLVIYKSLCHIYAQIINSNNKVLVSASTLEKSIYSNLEKTSNKNAAILIGKIIAKRAIEKKIKDVSFDRSGFKYHGKIKVLADSARENGLIF